MGDQLSNLMRVYNMLEDNQSKDIYLKRLNYLLTGDFKYIRDIVTKYTPDLVPWNGKGFDDLIASLPKEKGFVLYGAGLDGRRMLPFCEGDRRFIGFCADNKEKQKTGYLGYPVMSPEELLTRRDLSVVVCTSRARSEIFSVLEDGNYPQNLIFDGPAFYEQSIEDLGQYFDVNFMTFKDEEIFVDVGCFTLDTSLRLRTYCKHVKKIYAFEPDPHNYEICLKAKEKFHFPEAQIIPFGAWSKRTTLRFESVSDSGSRIHESAIDVPLPNANAIEVPVMPIDDAIEAGDRVTMIKMDVEGAELESLKGARRTIRRDKPKLAICIYHKPEDMVEIPLYIKELVPEYKFYIRHHSSRSGETVLYAMP